MAVTLPGHPRLGQAVEVVRTYPGVDPEVVVRAADGLHFALPMSGTDSPPGGPPPRSDPEPPPRLDPDGVRRLARLVDQLKSRATSASADPPADPGPAPDDGTEGPASGPAAGS